MTPLSRPEQASRVVHEFRAQAYSDRRLCLVANGPARDMLLNADLVIRTEPGKPTALNTAMDALRGEVIAIRDDDDRSLPGDLAECVDALHRTGADVVSRLRHHVLLDAQRWLFAEHHAEQWGTEAVWGGSLLFRVTPDVPPFPDRLLGEAQRWARRMTELGGRIWRPSTAHQIHVRRSFQGLWGAGPLEVRHVLSLGEPALRFTPVGPEWVPPPTFDEVAAEMFRTRRGTRCRTGKQTCALLGGH